MDLNFLHIIHTFKPPNKWLFLLTNFENGINYIRSNSFNNLL